MESVSFEENFDGNCNPEAIYNELKSTVVCLTVIKPPAETDLTIETMIVGTGVMIEGGYILTTAGIVQGNSFISLRYLKGEGTSFITCEVVCIDINKDLALLETCSDGGCPMKYAKFEKVEEIQTGGTAFCVSNRVSITVNRIFGGTFTSGYISFHRRLLENTNYIQISNNVGGNPIGSMGAPVFSSRGLLIGVLAKRYKSYDFAVPIDTVKEFVEAFRKEQGSQQGRKAKKPNST